MALNYRRIATIDLRQLRFPVSLKCSFYDIQRLAYADYPFAIMPASTQIEKSWVWYRNTCREDKAAPGLTDGSYSCDNLQGDRG